MTDAEPCIDLDVLAPSPAEHPPFQAAARQLSQLLGAATGVNHQIRLNLRRSLDLSELAGGGGVIIISLLSEMAQLSLDWADVALRWRRQAEVLAGGTARTVFFCTLFRHVPNLASPPSGWSRGSALERIRRLNRLTVELSQATGACVIDIDRTLTHVGARALATDYTLRGVLAPEVAGDVIAGALVGAGLDDIVSQDRLEKARQLHGGLEGLTRRFRRRLSAQRTMSA
jgi:hypothetical protein